MIRAVVLLALVLSACTTVTGQPTPDTGDAPVTSPVTAQVDVQFRPVEQAVPGGAPEPPDVLTDADGVAYHLGPAIGDFTRFEDVRAELGASGNWVVTIDLNAEDTAAFAGWTTDHVGSQLAIVVDGELITAPTIQSPITGGSVQIAGDFTKDDVDEMVAAITGG